MHLENSIPGSDSVINVLENYTAWSLDFNTVGIALINASTSSSIFVSDSSTVAETFEAAFEMPVSMWCQTFHQKNIKIVHQENGYRWIHDSLKTTSYIV